MSEILIEAQKQKDNLISNMKTIIMATTDKNDLPNSSYAPSYVDKNNHFYIFVSLLSKHTKNLISNKNVSFMIIQDESKTDNIFSRKRLTIDATAELVNRNSKDWMKIMEKMENKFGETLSYLKNLADFNLFKLTPQKGLLVHGFARAFTFSGENLDKINYLNEIGHSKN